MFGFSAATGRSPAVRNLLPLCGAAAMALTPMTAAAAQEQQPAAADSAVEARVEALLAQMTFEERAAQVTTSFAPPDPRLIKLAELRATTGGGSLLFVSDPVETNRLQRLAVEQSRLKIPMLFGFDVIHGLATIFPVPIANAASWDPATVEKTAAAAAAESRAVGIHWTFAPMIDIARDARWGRIVESAGEDSSFSS